MADTTSITIYRPTASGGASRLLTVPITAEAKAICTLGSEDYILLPFELEQPFIFKIGDYVDLTSTYGTGATAIHNVPAIARRYALVTTASTTYNNSTGGYKYELKFEAAYRKWQNRIYMYRTSDTLKEADFTLTTTLANQMEVFLESLRATYGNEGYGYRIDASVTRLAKSVSFSNTSFYNALGTLAQEFDCEWWVDGKTISFGRCEGGITTLNLKIGENIESISGTGNASGMTTRLYAYGSTRNISEAYHKNSINGRKYISAFVERRLGLPGKGYIDALYSATEDEVVEEVKNFDEIYPRTKLKITEVKTVEGKYTDSKDGKKKTELLYRFKCEFEDGTPFNFSSKDILPDSNLSIAFQLPQDKLQNGKENTNSPVLLSMEFDVAFNPDNEREKNENGEWNTKAQLWQIVPNEKYGRRLPEGNKDTPANNVMIPKVGDTFALLGWDIYSSTYSSIVTEAEKELLTAAQEYLAKSATDTSVYECPMLCDESSDMTQIFIGRRADVYSDSYDRLSMRNARIVGYTIKLDMPYDHPTVKVSQLTPKSRMEAMQQEIINFKKGADGENGTKGSNGEDAESYTMQADKMVVEYDNSGKPKAAQVTLRLYHTVGAKTTEVTGEQETDYLFRIETDSTTYTNKVDGKESAFAFPWTYKWGEQDSNKEQDGSEEHSQDDESSQEAAPTNNDENGGVEAIQDDESAEPHETTEEEATGEEVVQETDTSAIGMLTVGKEAPRIATLVGFKDGKTLQTLTFSTVKDGSTGLQGCIQRLTQWEKEKEYLNETGLDGKANKDGSTGKQKEVRYLDCVVVEDKEAPSGYRGYICKKSNTGTDDNEPGKGDNWSDYWIEMESVQPILTPMIMAQYGNIKFTQSNQLLIYDAENSKDNSKIVAGMAGGEFPLWVGGATPTQSPFYVSKNGVIHADPYSFIINESQLGDYVGLFQIVYKTDEQGEILYDTVDGKQRARIDSIIPQYALQKAEVSTTLKIGEATLSYDKEHGALHIDKTVFSDGSVSALGIGENTGGASGGAGFDILQRWETYNDETATETALSAFLGKELESKTEVMQTQLDNVEQRLAGGAANIEIDGDGNAVTSVTKEGDTITFNRGETFLTQERELLNDWNNYNEDTASQMALAANLGKETKDEVDGIRLNLADAYDIYELFK